MSKIDDIISAANGLNDQFGTLAVDQKALQDDTVALEGEDACATGFKEKIDAVSQRAIELTAQKTLYTQALNTLKTQYNDLGVFDFGDKPAALAALNSATTAIDNINSIARNFNGPSRREALRAKVAACPVNSAEGAKATDTTSNTNADPAAEKADANGTPSSQGENKSSDDNPKETQKTPPNTTNTNSTSDTGATGSGTQEVTITAKRPKKQTPGIRTANPLSNFSSYTYQLTLYMVTPDAYQAFVLSDRTKIDAINNASTPSAAASIKQTGNGAFIVAQSGGVNNSTSKRATGFDLDYYIDELKFTSFITGKDSKSETNSTEFSFNIYEPYGFSFISNLKRASDQLAKVSNSKNFSKNNDPTKQFFVLGIKFQGYDVDGNVLTGKEHFASDTFNPVGNSNGVFERFYDITIKTLKFKLDGRAVTYHLTAASTPQYEAAGMKRGIVDKDVNITALDVEGALSGNDTSKNLLGLMTKLNIIEQEMLNKENPDISIANKYSIKFIGETTDLKKAALKTKNDLDKIKWPNNPTKNVKDVNPALEVSNLPNSDAKTLKIVQGTPILQAISDIIKNSNYMAKNMTILNDADAEGNKVVKNDATGILRWFNVSPNVTCLGWDPKRNDFAYDIQYIIQPYETPAAIALMANKTTPYYGPHKRYEYWFTGKNSEILSYEQNMNNAFYVNVYDNPDTGSQGPSGVAKAPGKPSNISSQGSLDTGLQSFGPYLTSLFDPSAYASAKIQILGDPDYLMSTTASGISAVYNQFYGSDGFTINPNGGQVFIEVNFKEAQDYDTEKGYLNINDKILFWAYPKDAQVQGVSYQVKSVTSLFGKGKFTQTIDMFMNTFDEYPNTDAQDSGREPATQASVRALDNKIDASNTTGDQQSSENSAAASLTPTVAPANDTKTSPTGGSNGSSGSTGTTTMPSVFGGKADGTGQDGATYSSIFNLFPKTGNKTVTLIINTPAGEKLFDGAPDTVIAQLNADIQKFAAYPKFVELYTSARDTVIQQDQKYTTEFDQAKIQFATPAGTADNLAPASRAVQDGDSTGDGNKTTPVDEGGREG